MSYSVAISVFSLGGWRKGRGGCVRKIGREHDSCQAQKAENTDPRTNYAVKYATARGHPRSDFATKMSAWPALPSPCAVPSTPHNRWQQRWEVIFHGSATSSARCMRHMKASRRGSGQAHHLAWLPLQSPAVKTTFCLCKFWAL